MKALNHVVEFNARARNRLTHFRVHKHPRNGAPLYRHVCWWKFSLIFGQPHLEEVTICSHCEEIIGRINTGDESLFWCEGCRQVEGDTESITIEEYEKRHA